LRLSSIRIGAIEPDAQALNAARGKKYSQRETEGQHVAASGGQDGVDLLGDRSCNLLRPGLEQDVRDLVGKLLGAKEGRGQRGDQDQEWKQSQQN
jgi:hypothetical protein